ncbi:MAG TPA: SDR family NAD(P)-dependent oxidoreductase [Mycobacteriales bacterium]|nr:SDR family NAD(P)-dependent oxidoreductase [Mycobacteriales bacterium]
METLQDTAAVVIGGGSGLGEATARRLGAAGARVAVVDLAADRAAEVAAGIAGATAHTADVSSPDGLADALAEAREAHGSPRLGVVTSGIGPPQRILGKAGPADLSWFETTIRVNLIGSFNALRLFAASMADNDPDEGGERGAIVMTASIAAYEGQIGQAAYAASKGGVVGLTLPAARDLARNGIRVNTIAPGLMDTPLLASLPEDARKELAADVVFPPRLGLPEEYAELVVFAATSAYLNGEVIRLDGALRMKPR